MLSLSFIFVVAKEIESSGGDVPSVFKEGQFTLVGDIGEVYSVFRNMSRGKAAAAPSDPEALVSPAVLGSQERAEDDAKLSSMWYGKRCYKMMSHFLFHGPVKFRPCLAEGPSGLLLPLLYGCFLSLFWTIYLPCPPSPFLGQGSGCCLRLSESQHIAGGGSALGEQHWWSHVG